MPWKETCIMDERIRFVLAAIAEGAVMSHECEAFGISRKSGYMWLARYAAEGLEGLKDRSRAPHCHGRAYDRELVADVLALRKHYGWGGKKLRRKLGELRPELTLPAASTIGDWLAKQGLTKERRRRSKRSPHNQPIAMLILHKAEWSIHFLGWFCPS